MAYIRFSCGMCLLVGLTKTYYVYFMQTAKQMRNLFLFSYFLNKICYVQHLRKVRIVKMCDMQKKVYINLFEYLWIRSLENAGENQDAESFLFRNLCQFWNRRLKPIYHVRCTNLMLNVLQINHLCSLN